MSFNIIFTERAFKDLSKLNIVEKERIKLKLIEYSENPYFFSKKLTDSKLGDYRFRVGDFRIIFDIDDDKIKVTYETSEIPT